MKIVLRKEKKRFIVLIVSLMLHVLLLFSFFYIKLSRNASLQTLFSSFQKKKKINLNDIPASLKPKKSDFGTVVFIDKEFNVDDIPKQLPEKVAHKVDMKEKDLKIKDEHIVKEKYKDIKRNVMKKSSNDEKKTLLAERNKEESDFIKKKIEEIEKKQAMIKQNETLIEEQINQEEIKEEKKPPVKKKKNILALTRGFIENLKNKGEDILERKGDDSKKPSFEELKYLSYEQKISWQLQASWKRNFARKCKCDSGKVVIEFSINKLGNVFDVKLLQSSGQKQLDDVVLQNMNISSPFPPLPKHFNREIYTTARIISVSTYHMGF